MWAFADVCGMSVGFPGVMVVGSGLMSELGMRGKNQYFRWEEAEVGSATLSGLSTVNPEHGVSSSFPPLLKTGNSTDPRGSR